MKRMLMIFVSALLVTGINSCGSSDPKSGTSPVTINLGETKTASPSGKILGASSIPTTVASVRFTISAPDMATIERTVSVEGRTSISESFDVPNGANRHFLVEVMDPSGNVLYRGETYANLDGAAVSITIPMVSISDTTPPIFGGLVSATSTSSTEISLSWSAATDDVTSQSNIVYLVYMSTTSGGENFASPSFTTTPGATSLTATGLSQGTTYYFVVRAKDEAGNVDSNTVERFATISWAKTYGGTSSDFARSIQPTSDGGYIVAGSAYSFGADYYDFWVLKLAGNGTVQWEKTYSGAVVHSDYAYSIQQTSDGGYIVAGFTYSFGAGTYDLWVLKLNSNGTVAWEKTYGGTIEEYGAFIQQTSDGGYIIAGTTYSFGAGGADLWVLKLDSNGSPQWQKTYGGTGEEYATSIQQTSEGGYIVAGYTMKSFGNDAWILKLDSSGGITWEKTYGRDAITGDDDYAYSIQQTSDGGYIVAGATASFGAGSDDIWVSKLAGDGTVQWQKTYGGTGSDYAESIRRTSDGGYIVAGGTDSFGAGNTDLWVLKLNSDGSAAWQKTYGGAINESAYSIRQTSDGGYIVAGSTNSFGAGGMCGTEVAVPCDDFWLLKLNSDGTINFNPASGASSTDTNATVTDTTVTGVDTTATVTDTSAVITDTSATITDTNATITQQVP